MKLSDQVISLLLAKRLKELGVEQDDANFWWSDHTIPATFWNTDAANEEAILPEFLYAAFTVAELGALLPGMIKSGHGFWHLNCEKYHDGKWRVYYNNVSTGTYKHDALQDTEAEARGLILAYLIEQKLV